MGGEGQHGRALEVVDGVGQAQVRRAEVVAPLGNAVCLVDDEQFDVDAQELLAKLRVAQALGRHVRDARFGPGQALHGGGFFPGAQGAVQTQDVDAQMVQLVVLVLHEGDEGRHDEGLAREGQGWQLIAQRLARAGRHDGQGVLAVEDVADGELLPWSKRVDAEAGLGQVEQPGRRGIVGGAVVFHCSQRDGRVLLHHKSRILGTWQAGAQPDIR